MAGREVSMSPRIRSYRNADAVEIGKLIADTFLQFNLTYASPCEQQKLLGPFRHAESSDPDHRAAIAAAIRAPLVLVAEDESQKIIVEYSGAVPGGFTASSFAERTIAVASAADSLRSSSGTLVMPHTARLPCNRRSSPSLSISG